MEILLNGGDFILKGEGQVAWVRKPEGANENLPAGMGIKFLDLEPESQLVLNSIISRRKK
jgi:hypothetical protein